MNEEQITRLLERVGQTLSSGDVAGVARCFAVPALALADNGAMVMADLDAIERSFAGAVAAYRSRGVAATRPELECVELLSERLAAVDVRGPALDTSGAELERERSHYLLWLADDGQPRIRVALTKPA